MIENAVNRVTYRGDGQATEFAFTFPVIEKTDLVVVTVSPENVETTLTKDYFVDMDKKVVKYPGYSPGEEPPENERPPVLPTGWKIVLYRSIAQTQESSLGDVWPFNLIEAGLDKLTMIVQDLFYSTKRTMKLSAGAPDDVDPTLPIPEPNSSMYWDGEGKKLIIGANPNLAAADASASATASANSAALSQKWASGTESPDGGADTDSTTGKTQSSKSWALYAKARAAEAGESRDSASASKDTATEKAEAAAASETNAAASKNAAAQSAANAAESETNAKASETAAKTSENNAATSKTSAEQSRQAANASEEAAGKSATASANSAALSQKWASGTESPDGGADTDSTTGKTQSSKSWAMSAKTSQTAAKASETSAAQSAADAKKYADDAKTSAGGEFLPLAGGTLGGNLAVQGNITADGTITGSQVFNAVYNDYAEFFPRGEDTEPGDIVALDLHDRKERYIKATDKSQVVAGVHSGEFAQIIGGDRPPANMDFLRYNLPRYIPVALAGRVHVKVAGPVLAGDHIVPSSIPGIGVAGAGEYVGIALQDDHRNEIKLVKILLRRP